MQKSATIVPVDTDDTHRIENENVDSTDAKGLCEDATANRGKEVEKEEDRRVSDDMIDSAQQRLGRKIVFNDEVASDVALHRVRWCINVSRADARGGNEQRNRPIPLS